MVLPKRVLNHDIFTFHRCNKYLGSIHQTRNANFTAYRFQSPIRAIQNTSAHGKTRLCPKSFEHPIGRRSQKNAKPIPSISHVTQFALASAFRRLYLSCSTHQKNMSPILKSDFRRCPTAVKFPLLQLSTMSWFESLYYYSGGR